MVGGITPTMVDYAYHGAGGYRRGGLHLPLPHKVYRQNLYTSNRQMYTNPPPNRQNNYRFQNSNTRQNQYNARMVYPTRMNRNTQNLPTENANFSSKIGKSGGREQSVPLGCVC